MSDDDIFSNGGKVKSKGDQSGAEPQSDKDAGAPGSDAGHTDEKGQGDGHVGEDLKGDENDEENVNKTAEQGSSDDPVPENELDNALTEDDFRRLRAEIRELRAAAFGAGDAVGRDKIINRFHLAGADSGRAWRIRVYSADEIHHRLERFAGTATRQILADLLRDQRVVVLKGPAGGRKTTALAALSLRCDGVSLMQSDRVPADLTTDDVTLRHGYIFDASHIRWATWLEETALLGCEEVLQKQDARLVVIVSPQAGTASAAIRSRLVEYQPPDPLNVLDGQLSAELPGGVVQQILNEIDELPDTVHEAVDLAAELAKGYAEGRAVSETLASRPDPLRDRARELLRQDHSIKEEKEALGRRAFVVASAVLDGLPVAYVCRAAQGLAQQLFQTESSHVHAKLGQFPFADVMRDWRYPAKKGFAEAVLDVVWLDYVISHKALLSWLKEIAEDRDSRIRAKAALALGWLATYDFDLIAQEFFIPWSRRPNGALHDVIAWALEAIVMWRPEKYYERVFALADEWALDGGVRRSVAARIYGTYIGLGDPIRAMNGLYQIARSSPDSVDWLVVWSVTELVAAGKGVVVIDALAGWIASPSPDVRQIVAKCLAELSKLDHAGRPVLMLLFDERPDRLTEFWRRVLLSRASRKQAWGVLRVWKRDRVDFSGLRIRLAGDEQLRRPLQFYLGLSGI